MPTQNCGRDWPKTAISLAPPSKKVSRLTAANTPKGMPMAKVITIAVKPRRRELPTLGAIRSITGRLALIESPNSKRTALLINFQYCTGQD